MLVKLRKRREHSNVEVHYICNSSGMSVSNENSLPSLSDPCRVSADDRDVRREYADRAATIIWRERLARALFCSACDKCDEDTLAKLVYEPDESKFDWDWLHLHRKTPPEM
jgi:hypothetical protein